MQLPERELFSIVFNMQVGSIEEYGTTKLSRVIDNQVFQGHARREQAELHFPDLCVESCFSPDPLFRQVSRNVVLEQKQPYDQHER
jgi:hypothetical protein